MLEMKHPTRPAVRFIKKWGSYCVGDIIQPVAAIRNSLMRQGIVEPVEEKPVNKSPQNRAVLSVPAKRKKKNAVH